MEDDDVAAVVAALRSGWLTGGPAVANFESKLVDAVGAEFAVACSSGTAGLHLAVLALGIGEGDAVIVPTLTFLATANVVRHVGAEVIFADVDPETGLMRDEDFRAAIERAGSARIKAVIPVHMCGQSADMPAIAETAREHGIRIIEDACHALGTDYRSARVGKADFSDMAVFSFHPTKTLTMGEGGAVTTNDAGLAERIRLIRNHGMIRDFSDPQLSEEAFDPEGQPNPWYYEMRDAGFNYRASDPLCALGANQLTKLDRIVSARRKLADRYDELLAPLAPRVRPLPRVPDCAPAWNIYAVLIDFETAGMSRATMMNRLKDRGIGTQVHYLPLHRQPYYRELYGDLVLPGADSYYARCLALPLFSEMSGEDVAYVVTNLGSELAGKAA